MLSPETVRIVTETTPAGSSARWRVQAAAPDGLISNDLYDQVNVGDRLEVSPPCGEFTLKPANGAGPVVLLAGGTGIMPLLSTAKSLVQAGSTAPIYVPQAVNNSRVQALADDVGGLATD